MNDEELAQLLKPLRDLQPAERQIRSWQLAVRLRPRARWVVQMTAAALVGFLAGALIFKNLSPALTAQNFALDATYEHSHTNLDE